MKHWSLSINCDCFISLRLTASPPLCCEGAGVSSTCLRAKAGSHPGRVASLSQGHRARQTTHTYDPFSQTSSQSSDSRARFWTVDLIAVSANHYRHVTNAAILLDFYFYCTVIIIIIIIFLKYVTPTFAGLQWDDVIVSHQFSVIWVSWFCFFFKPMETIKSRWVRRERCSVEDPCWQSDQSVASGTEVWRWLQGLQSGDPERYNRNLSVWLPLNSPRASRPLTVQRCFTSTLSTGEKSCDTDFPPCQTEATRSGLQHWRQLTQR